MSLKNIIFDAHQDVLWYEQNKQSDQSAQTGIKDLIESSIKLVTVSVFLEPEKTTKLSTAQKAELVEQQIKQYLTIINNNKKLFLLQGKSCLDYILRANLTGLLIHIEGADFIENDNLEILDYFYDLGLRSIGLVWGSKNNLASAAGAEGGLTKLGKRLIQKANKMGIIVDMAHANEQSFYDAVKESTNPVMISHANCFAVCKSNRNLTDGQIRMIGSNGGVQGIYFSGKFVNDKNAGINDALNHIKHSYSISPNTTMIGSDFGGITSGLVKGLESINDLPVLLDKVERELGKKAMIKIAYQNYYNFLKSVL